MRLSGAQCRAARALLGWSMAELVSAAGVGDMTLHRFEAGQNVRAGSVDKIADALGTAGIIFIDEGEASAGAGVGVRLAKS